MFVATVCTVKLRKVVNKKILDRYIHLFCNFNYIINQIRLFMTIPYQFWLAVQSDHIKVVRSENGWLP